MTTTNYARLPQIDGFLMLDTAQNGEADLKSWPAVIAAFVALMLGVAGVYVWLRHENGDIRIEWALLVEAVILTIIFSLAWIVHQWQKHGNAFFNVQKARRGFRVVTTQKDKK